MISNCVMNFLLLFTMPRARRSNPYNETIIQLDFTNQSTADEQEIAREERHVSMI